jgi:hypothetical protein
MPSIFLLQNATGLVEMTEQPYESEDLLQALLAEHPSVLAGDQFNGAEPKRWLLVGREAGVPCEDSGPGRWSLDHLFVDQNGIPTLVEVKRSSDTRIRREVIGQMFDYAANAVVYWPAGEIRSRYERDCEVGGADPEQRLIDFLRSNLDVDTEGVADRFWGNVDTNLRAGRIRMVFVADMVPPELRRIVEFLNGQMSPAEVLAIEIKQFTGSNVTTLVPTVIGQTAQAAAQRDRSARPAKQWDRSSFFDALRTRKGEDVCRIAERLFQWSDSVLPAVWFGNGSQDGSCFRGLGQKGKNIYLFAVWTNGRIELQFQWFKYCPSFDSDTARLELLRRINEIPALRFGPDAITRRPAFDLLLLGDSDTEARFHNAVEWAVGQIANA